MPRRDVVYLKHDDVEVLGGPVPRSTVEAVWAPLGWSAVEPGDVASESKPVAHVPATPPEPTEPGSTDGEPKAGTTTKKSGK